MRATVLLFVIFCAFVHGSNDNILINAIEKLNQEGHDLKLIKLMGKSGGVGMTMYRGEFGKSNGDTMDCVATWHYKDVVQDGEIHGTFRLQCGQTVQYYTTYNHRI